MLEQSLLLNIQGIIEQNFNEQEVNDSASMETSQRIKKLINEYTQKKCFWENWNFLVQQLEAEYGQKYSFEKQVHFDYYNDRCLQIYIYERDENKKIYKYCARISIFGYYLICKSNAQYLDKYKILLEQYAKGQIFSKDFKEEDSELYIDQAEDPFCDSIYRIINSVYPQMKWLPRIILNQKIEGLRIYPNLQNKEVDIADILFRNIH